MRWVEEDQESSESETEKEAKKLQKQEEEESAVLQQEGILRDRLRQRAEAYVNYDKYYITSPDQHCRCSKEEYKNRPGGIYATFCIKCCRHPKLRTQQ